MWMTIQEVLVDMVLPRGDSSADTQRQDMKKEPEHLLDSHEDERREWF
jgi:hypothetical protein